MAFLQPVPGRSPQTSAVSGAVPARGPVDSLGSGLASAGAVLAALLVGAVAYRLRLAEALHDPRQWAGEPVAPSLVLRQLVPDALLSLAVVGVGLLVAQAGARLGSRWPRLRQAAGLSIWAVLLLLYGMLGQAQRGTLLATGTGLTLELLREALDPAALRESILLLDRIDSVCLVLPALTFLGLWPLLRRLARAAERPAGVDAATTGRGARVLVGAPFGLLAAAAGLLVAAALWPAAPLGEATLHHPVGALLAELVHRGVRADFGGPAAAAATTAGTAPLGAAGAASEPGDPVDPAEPGDPSDPADPGPGGPRDPGPASAPAAPPASAPTLALVDPQFVVGDPALPRKKVLPPGAGEKPYNVVVVLMESTGFDYALKPQPDGRVAMPFLAELGRRGTLLGNHYSAGNSSPRGIFSLMSGLYVMPEVAIWDVRKDIFVPSLVSYLGAAYRAFLVTPASLDWYFPHAFMQHAGFGELYGYHALPVRKNAPGGRSHARDEAETVDFFLKRLQEQTAQATPFVGVYYSFVAHWPYPDYGPESHFMSPTRPLNLYYNNLHYLDKKIQLIYKKCEELGLIDNTIFVIAGDHGEAFGQHAHNYTHSRMSYNENFRTPVLLLHPRLFPPRRVTEPTSHVDVLPTLLDALGVRYEPRRLQGESLFQESFQRRYIFLYGNEDTISSISAEQIKMQFSFRENACWVFDLKTDPGETRRLSCQPYTQQREALLAYRKNQQLVLRRYNEYSRLVPVGRERTAAAPSFALPTGTPAAPLGRPLAPPSVGQPPGQSPGPPKGPPPGPPAVQSERPAARQSERRVGRRAGVRAQGA
ncbi:MAG: sulfatase-like hydrolase/transferase [Polyangia bacterium]